MRIDVINRKPWVKVNLRMNVFMIKNSQKKNLIILSKNLTTSVRQLQRVKCGASIDMLGRYQRTRKKAGHDLRKRQLLKPVHFLESSNPTYPSGPSDDNPSEIRQIPSSSVEPDEIETGNQNVLSYSTSFLSLPTSGTENDVPVPLSFFSVFGRQNCDFVLDFIIFTTSLIYFYIN